MNDPREVKLPRWAQEELAKARQEAADATKKLNEHLEQLPKTGVWYGKYENPIYIPDGDQVHWQMREGSKKTFGTISVFKAVKSPEWGAGGRLIVNGDRSLQVLPSASNTVYIDLVD
jgi:hypothetical protein